jgi:UDP-glucuronate decarboxylase
MDDMTARNPQNIVWQDLEYICNGLAEEFACLSGKKLLITGGAGFLGYYLIQAVLHWNETTRDSKSIQVTVYDNYCRGFPVWLTKLRGNRNLVLVKHDMSTPLPQNIGDFQYIIHAASIASLKYILEHPIETMDANVQGLRFLLEYCRAQQEKRKGAEGFLFFSSSEIYGDPSPESIPLPENYRGNVSCTGPRSCYDEAKRYGETLSVNFALQYGLPIRIARPFNNYGPGQRITDGRVIPDFAKDILAERDIRMLSDGSPTRTFCYVADAIIGYYRVLLRGRDGEAYNIGAEKPEISIAELAEQLADIGRDIFKYRGQIVRQVSCEPDYLTDNPNRRCPMIAKARTELGFNPKITLREGLRRTLIWYRDNDREALC